MSSAAAPSKPSVAACERCHRRRIRCDAWQTGPPCSSCTKSGNGETCRVLRSKKARGRDGRYKESGATQSTVQQALSQNDVPGNVSSTLPTAKDNPSPRSVLDPAVNDEIVRLCTVEPAVPRPDDGFERFQILRDGPVAAQQETSIHHVSDSWYASYVLSHCALMTNPGSVRSSTFDTPVSSFIPQTQSARGQDARDADLPGVQLTSRLLDAYFSAFHPFCPVLDKSSFLTTVDNGAASTTLLRCVLFIASIHCDMDLLHDLGYSTRTDAGDDLFGKASIAFNADKAMSRPTLVLCSYLLHYWFGKPTTYQDSPWWLSTAIRAAQFLNYHRDVPGSSPAERSNARRIWWCLYIRDRQVSLSMSTPMAINDLDSDIGPLTIDDFDPRADQTARYIMLQADLNRCASLLFYRHCSPARLRLAQDFSVFEDATNDLSRAMQEWLQAAQTSTLWSQTSPLSLILKVCYHYYIINLTQRLRRVHSGPKPTASSQSLLLASDHILRLVEESFAHFAPQRFPMIYVSALLSAISVHLDDMKAHRQSHAHLAQRIRPYLHCLQRLESVYVLAGWVLKLFLSILNRGSQAESTSGHEAGTPSVQRSESGFDESGFDFFLRTLPSSPLNAEHIAQLSMPASFEDLK